MPFVTVTSKGGPHDDESFVAGWQMGGISALLHVGQPAVYEVLIATACVPQADLIAMDKGYTVRFIDTEVDGYWTQAIFSRATELAGGAE